MDVAKIVSAGSLPVTVLAVALSAQPSLAFSPGCPCGAVQGMHSQTRQHVSRETTETARQIVGALREHSGQNSRYLDRQVEAIKRIADGQEQNSSLRLRDRFRAEAESGRFDPNSDFCLLMDISGESGGNSLRSANGPRDVVRGASDWMSGAVVPVQEHGVKMAAYLAAEREELKNAGGAKDATTDWKLVTGHPTIPLDDLRVQNALARLVSNTIDPFPSRPLTEQDLRTPAGLSEAARRRATEARNHAAMAAIELALELGNPVLPSDPYRRIAARSHYAADIPDMISELQRLDIRVASYDVPTEDTLEERHRKNERALLQDLIDIQSLSARLNFHRLQQESRNSVVLAAILGVMTDGTTTTLLSN